MPPLSKIKLYFKKYNKIVKRIFKKTLKGILPYWGILSIILLLGVFVLCAKLSLKSLSGRDFSFFTAEIGDKISFKNLFVSPVRNFIIESPEMSFVQGNSVVGVCPPETITPQILGSLLGTIEPAADAEDTIIEYTVKEDETLSSVADKFNISLNTILWANDLGSRSVVKTGQKLIILPVSGVVHLVSKGETLSGLAKIYQADLEEIIAFNNLSHEGDIFIGDVLIIPEGEMPPKLPQIATIPLAESYFIFPTEGSISQGLHGVFRNAIDISNRCGKIVVAAAGGVVQRAGPISIGGNRITILHPNGVVTYYGHLSIITVIPGQTVSTGQVIGYVGNSGYTLGPTGCHLHFEVRGATNFLAKYPVGSYLTWSK